MRLSLDEKDPGFQAWLDVCDAGRIARIYLDGTEISHVLTADDDLGYVLKFKHDEQGDPVAIGDEWAVEEMHGIVKIVVGAS